MAAEARSRGNHCLGQVAEEEEYRIKEVGGGECNRGLRRIRLIGTRQTSWILKASNCNTRVIT